MAMASYGPDVVGGSNVTTPAPPSAPVLPPGIGNAAQANQASQFMRAQPWYQDFLKSQGQNPNNVHLTKDQSFQLLQLARQKGVGISTKYSLDSSGNIVSEGMPGWEKAVIGAGIVAAGIVLAPAVIAAFGSEAAATSAATAAAAGDTSAAAALTSAGVEAGAVSGLGAAALPGAGTALGGAALAPVATLASAAGGAGAAASDVGAGAAPALASSTIAPTGALVGAPTTAADASGAFDAAGNFIGQSTYNTGADVASGAAASGGGIGDILRYAVPTAGSVIGGLIQANASSNASAAQQKYLQEALDYEKQRDAAAIALEGSRYSNYSANIAPYLATGNSANARMTSLLGLPASPTSTAPSVTYQPSATSTGAGATIGAPTASVTTGPPLPRASDGSTPPPASPSGPPVMMRGLDGSTKQIPPEQVQYWQSKGAQVVG
jgi:hypothetical protein